MKHKKLWISLGIIGGVLLVVFVLCLTLFRVKNVTLDFASETKYYNQDAQNELLSQINVSKSIFTVNKKELIQKIESQNEYIKVINIETVFPNGLVIHCTERQELYVLKSENNLFFVDEDFKILKITSNIGGLGQSIDDYLNARNLGDPIYLENIIIKNPGATVGEFLDVQESEIIKNIYASFFVNNRDIGELKYMIKKITLSHEMNYYTVHNEAVLTITLNNDFKTEIYLPKSNLNKKVQIMLLSIAELSPEKFADYTLKIEENPENSKLFVNFVKKQST